MNKPTPDAILHLPIGPTLDRYVAEYLGQLDREMPVCLYSTSVAGSKAVLEVMHQNGFRWEAIQDGNQYLCRLRLPVLWQGSDQPEAIPLPKERDQRPAAVCRAALLAVMHYMRVT
jgi:hypothetical protein